MCIPTIYPSADLPTIPIGRSARKKEKKRKKKKKKKKMGHTYIAIASCRHEGTD